MVTSSCTNRCACDIRSSDSSSRARLDDIAHFFQARRSLKRLVERYGRWRKCRGRASSRSVGAQASRCVRHLRRPEANSTSSNRNFLEQVRSSLSDRVDLARDSESEIAGAGGGPTASAVSPCCSRGARSVGRGSATPLRSSPARFRSGRGAQAAQLIAPRRLMMIRSPKRTMCCHRATKRGCARTYRPSRGNIS